ncbi:MAG: PAS domain S-box protein [Planctomycetota bacterium]|nr:MAG: PAS domain S-box protein [Planctomycetota bacterium]
MLLSTKQALIWTAAGAVVGTVLFAGYLLLSAWGPERAPTWPEQIAGVAVLSALAAGTVVWAARRKSRQTLEELSDCVVALREDPALNLIQSLPPEWGPFSQQLDALAKCYRQALADYVAHKQAFEDLQWEHKQAEVNVQSLEGRADKELGQSLFRLRRWDTNSRNMVARLTPNFHWMAATAALQQFLGCTATQLNGRPFFEVVHPEDVADLNRALHESLETGEGHNIVFRLRTRSGSEHHVQIDVLTRYSQENVPLHLRCFFLDITEKVRTDGELRRLASALHDQAEELQQANTELRRINRELDDFSYVVSHDLKEPLRTLEAFSTFLSQDYGNKLGPDGHEYISHLIQASRRLRALIDDLLSLSRAGRIINSPQAFDMIAAFETARLDLADLIQRKGATLRTEGPLPAVSGDPQRVTQLLSNLVSNGLKYNASRQPEVVLGQALAKKPHSSPDLDGRLVEHVTLFVRDNGIGIDPQYHEQIFRIFRRLHRREDYEGTGAGLAICKKIVEAHGGRIWVESQPGQGATFYFTLPKAGAGLPAAAGEGGLSGSDSPSTNEAPRGKTAAAAGKLESLLS